MFGAYKSIDPIDLWSIDLQVPAGAPLTLKAEMGELGSHKTVRLLGD